MQELVGRLKVLDPEAGETLKVVSYFDALTANAVGLEGLLRGAAALTGVPVGLRQDDRVLRIASDGSRLETTRESTESWPSCDAGPAAVIWLERSGTPHANDTMVLERLAIAISVTVARRSPDMSGAVESAVNENISATDRRRALIRLRLDSAPSIRAIATPPTARSNHPSAVVLTSHGAARVTLLVGTAPFPFEGRGGIGVGVPPERAAESWASALLALRLSTDRQPIMDAASLGAILLIADIADDAVSLHPDAVALSRLDERASEILEAFADTGSVRAAAARVGMHHSSVQQRLATLDSTLGYDVHSTVGRARYVLAHTLLLLSRPGLPS